MSIIRSKLLDGIHAKETPFTPTPEIPASSIQAAMQYLIETLLIGTTVQGWDVNLDQIAALTPTDGNVIVGDGSAWVAESGATARASLGVYSTTETDAAIAAAVTAEDLDFAGDSGTGAVDLDSQSLSIITTNDSLVTSAASQALTIALADVLEDIDALGPNAADGEFLVGTGAGALAWESGNTARTSLGLGTGDSPTLTALTLSSGTGLTVGSSVPFSDAAGVLTLQNVDALDATTEATIETAIDTLSNLTSIQGVSFTFGAYAATLLNNANEAAFKAAVNLEAGVDYQAYDAGLLSIAGLTTAADTMIYTTASDTYATTTLTSFARSILDDADEATFKATVNLEAGTDFYSISAADAAIAAYAQPVDADLTAIAALTTTAAGRSYLELADPNADTITIWDDSAGTPVNGTPTNGVEISGTNVQMTSNQRTGCITYVIDGGGATITTGIKGDFRVPAACTISGVTALADQSGSIVVDIWKDTYANYPPLDADSITASAPVTISAATKSEDTTLTGWTTSVSAGDILRFNVDSVTSVQRLTIEIRVAKT